MLDFRMRSHAARLRLTRHLPTMCAGMHAPPERTAMWFWFMTIAGPALIVASVAALGTALGEKSVARRWHSLTTIVVFLTSALPLGLFVSMVSFVIPEAVERSVFHTTGSGFSSCGGIVLMVPLLAHGVAWLVTTTLQLIRVLGYEAETSGRA